MVREDRAVWIVLIISVIAALYVLGHRFVAEQHNRAVELSVDYTEVQQLASSSGQPIEAVLRRFGNVGASSAAIEVQTIGSLINAGAVQLLLDADAELYISTKNPIIARQLIDPLRPYLKNPEAFSAKQYSRQAAMMPPAFSFPVRADPELLRNLPVSLPADAVDATRSAGMGIVLRFANYPGIDQSTIRRVLREGARAGVKTVIFSADQVAGFRGLIDQTAKAIREYNLNYGSVEFGKQKGDAHLSRLTEERLIRVHSISDAEMSQLDEGSAIERYVRAARERGIRLEYVHMFDTASADPVAANAEFIRKVAQRLLAYGFGLKQARPLEDVSVPIWLLILMSPGVAAGTLLLLTSVFVLPVQTKAVWMSCCSIVFCGLAAAPVDLGRKLVALAAAFVFPTMAIVYAGQDIGGKPAHGRVLRIALARLAKALIVTVMGGVLVAGLLSSRNFMLKIDQFSGIKAAHLVPLFLVFLLYTLDVAWQRALPEEQRKRAARALEAFLGRPILVWQAVVLVIVLLIVGLLIARSGNEPGMGVSSIELRIRAMLDHILYVRPRTKEFLIGHPLLFLGVIFAVAGRRNVAVPFLILGSIGQISVLNTFCHIHTPIALSAARVLVGAVIGLIIGVALYLIIRRTDWLKAGDRT